MLTTDLTEALMYFGAMVGEPIKRGNLISKAAAFTDPEDVALVIAYCVARWDQVPGVAAAYLTKALSGPRKWKDMVECARTWRRYAKSSKMPDHYCLSGKVDPVCAHGRPGNKSCPECNGQWALEG